MRCPTCAHEFVDAEGAAGLLGIPKGRFHNLLSAGSSGMPPPVGLVGRNGVL